MTVSDFSSICSLSFPHTPVCLHSSMQIISVCLSICLTSSSLSLCVCSRLVQREQGLSMKIFNHTPRLLDSPHFLFNSPNPPFCVSPPNPPSLSALAFLNPFCKYMFIQYKRMVWTAVKTVHFTMWKYWNAFASHLETSDYVTFLIQVALSHCKVESVM